MLVLGSVYESGPTENPGAPGKMWHFRMTGPHCQHSISSWHRCKPSEKSKLRTEAASWKQAFCFRHETLRVFHPILQMKIEKADDLCWSNLVMNHLRGVFPHFQGTKTGVTSSIMGFLGTQTVGGGETIKCRTCRHRMYTTEAGGLKGSQTKRGNLEDAPKTLF